MINNMIDRRRFLLSTTILAAVGTATFVWAADAKDAEALVANLVADINAVSHLAIQIGWLDSLKRFLNRTRCANNC